MAITLLYVVEFVTIVAATQIRLEFYSEQSFDPKISAVQNVQRPRKNDNVRSDCDDFFIPTRGLVESGKVLKCVSEVDEEPHFGKGYISMSVLYYSGRTLFDIHSSNGSAARVELSTFLQSKSRVNMRTMPFRPDLADEHERKHLLNSIANGVRRRLQHKELDARHTLWSERRSLGSGGVLQTMDFEHYYQWNDSLETIKTALTEELRYMDLVLNSTGKPWVFRRRFTFEQMNAAMAVVKQYRIDIGWLASSLVILSITLFVMNSNVTHFDEIAFVAMKELMGEDCVLGPLVTDGRLGRDVDLREGDGTLS
ncbi:hypothetical protein FGB62_286g01 [Gracilaria domingensis]|nr:hypothetical protein FGB62_286g01 [Gracilaria domingensis]